MSKEDLSKWHILIEYDTWKSCEELKLSGIIQLLWTDELDFDNTLAKWKKNSVIIKNASLGIFNQLNGNPSFIKMVESFGFKIKEIFDLNWENISADIRWMYSENLSKINNNYKDFLLNRDFYVKNRNPETITDEETIKIRKIIIDKIKTLYLPHWITLKISKPEDITWKIASDNQSLLIYAKDLFEIEENCNTRIWTVNIFELNKWFTIFNIWDKNIQVENSITGQLLRIETNTTFEIVKFHGDSVDLKWTQDWKPLTATVWTEDIYKKQLLISKE